MIKNIIFDLGNVILNIDTKLSEKAFAKHGLNNFGELYTLAAQSEIFDRLEVGSISPSDFYSEFRHLTKSNLSDEIIRNCWNALILDYPPARIKLLADLKQKYRTFLLSNTNRIHYEFYNPLINEQFGFDGLESFFEKAYFSHEIGMKKPDPKIFEFVLENSNLIPAETLFIDDNKANIEAASALGIQTLWLKDNNLEIVGVEKLL
ncbi:MAG: HAD family phosphatase [Bacteroidales bacterium]|nr:HAD family phosphatase [Bacteroidales bacterium]